MTLPPQQGQNETATHITGQESRLEKATKIIDFFQKFILLIITISSVFYIGFIMLASIHKKMIIIERFPVSKKIQEFGYDSKTLERHISDEILDIVKTTTSKRIHRPILLYDKMPQVEIEKKGISFETFVQAVENFYGKRRHFVSGEVTTDSKNMVYLTIRVEGEGSRCIVGSVEEMKRILQEAALYVLEKTEPYFLASYYYMIGNSEKALKWVRYCVTISSKDEAKWAYNLWGIYYSVSGMT